MAPKCAKCIGTINKNHKQLKCDVCPSYFHQLCTFVPDSVYTAMVEAKDKSWVCETCRNKFKQIEQENVRLVTENIDLKKFNEALSSQLVAVEAQIASLKTDIKTEILRELRNDGVSNNQVAPQKEILACMREEKEREKRKLNLFISNFPESSESTDDTAEISKLLVSQLGFNHNEIQSAMVQVNRLGEPKDRPRSVIVQLNSASTKRKILEHSSKLKDYRTPANKKVFISPDLTPNQQRENKMLVEKLWELRAAGKMVTIKRGRIVEQDSTAFSTNPTTLPSSRR